MADKKGKNAHKSDNITIRVSKDLKKRILNVATDQNLKPSEYIRNCVIANMENQNKDIVIKKLQSSYEDESNKRFLSPLSVDGKVYLAISQVISNDTSYPPGVVFDQCEKFFSIKNLPRNIRDSMQRELKEMIFNDFVFYIKEYFDLSNAALLIIKSIYMTHLSYEFNSPISISSATLDLFSLMDELKQKPFGQFEKLG